MIQFLNPIWLWGLSGLLIPIVIHLLSRKEGKIIRFGSLRHLRESDTARFRSIRLNELVLLFLRCLLLTLIVFFIAGFQFNINQDAKVRWLVVEKGIEKLPRFQLLFDSLKTRGYEARYLFDDFPDINDSVPNLRSNYWLLVEDLRRRPLEDIIIASYSYLKNFNGERIPLPANVRWLTFEPDASTFPVEAIQLRNDSIIKKIAYSNANATYFESEKTINHEPGNYLTFASDSIPISIPDTVTINIVSDEDFDYDQKIILASIKAIQAFTPHNLIVNKLAEGNWNDQQPSDWLIILKQDSDTDAKHPMAAADQKIIAYKKCQAENLPLLIRGSSGIFSCEDAHNIEWIITKRLNEEISLRENLSLTLAKILLSESTPNYFHENDKRVLPEAMLWSTSKKHSDNSKDELNHASQPYLIIFIFMTLLTERFLAYKKNQ